MYENSNCESSVEIIRDGLQLDQMLTWQTGTDIPLAMRAAQLRLVHRRGGLATAHTSNRPLFHQQSATGGPPLFFSQ